VLGVLALLGARALLAAGSPRTRAARLVAGGVFAVLGVALLARVATMPFDPPPQDLFRASPFHAAVVTLVMLGYAVLMFALPLLLFAKERARIADLALFPEEDPNPVMRFRRDATLLYGNAASREMLAIWGLDDRGRMPSQWCARLQTIFDRGTPSIEELRVGDRTFATTLVPIVAHGYLNLYATDITARKVAEKSLRAANETLERRVRERTAELEQRLRERRRAE
jgi:hypothetical protein